MLDVFLNGLSREHTSFHTLFAYAIACTFYWRVHHRSSESTKWICCTLIALMHQCSIVFKIFRFYYVTIVIKEIMHLNWPVDPSVKWWNWRIKMHEEEILRICHNIWPNHIHFKSIRCALTHAPLKCIYVKVMIATKKGEKEKIPYTYTKWLRF